MSKKPIEKDAETAREVFEKLPEDTKEAMKLKRESERTAGKKGLKVDQKIDEGKV